MSAGAKQPRPIELRLRTKSRLLHVGFDDGSEFEMPFEYLRVFSPSAEVRGHGGGELVLVLGKEDVGVNAVEPVGNYAVRLVFDDGHNTGLYTWRMLFSLGRNMEKNMAHYRERVAAATAERADD